MEKINVKVLLYIFIILVGGFLINTRYEKYIEIKNLRKDLVEKNIELDDKISEIKKEQNDKKKKLEDEFKQIEVMLKKIEFLTIKDESEFKKMIYIFAKESNLKLMEIAKSEKVWEKNGYTLKCIYFNLYGSLNDFGKFMYFVNKSKKYIDTSKMYIELTSEGFKISLGFIEKNKIKIN